MSCEWWSVTIDLLYLLHVIFRLTPSQDFASCLMDLVVNDAVSESEDVVLDRGLGTAPSAASADHSKGGVERGLHIPAADDMDIHIPDAAGGASRTEAAAKLQQVQSAVVSSLAAFPAARSPLSRRQLALVAARMLQQLASDERPGASCDDVQSALRGLTSLASKNASSDLVLP